jgi:hypothetical protein
MENEKQHFQQKAKAEQEALEWLVKKKALAGEVILTTPSPTQFSSFDNFVNSGTTEYMAEIKVRKDITGTQADKWGGPMFEFIKHSGMCDYKDIFGHKNEMIYINFFKDEVRIYKIRKDPTYYSWYLKKLPKNNYDKRLVWKYVVDLQQTDLIETIKYGK